MAILVNKDTKVVVQGITGGAGSQHAKQCLEYGTKIVAGVTPHRGGEMWEGKVPVFNTVKEAIQKTGADTSLIFVPPPGAADAIMEAAEAGARLIVCITGAPLSRGKARASHRPQLSGHHYPWAVQNWDYARSCSFAWTRRCRVSKWNADL